MNEADLLLVFGASFSNHTGITPKIPTIQVDYDAMTLGKFHAIDVPVWGEIGVTAAALLEALPADSLAAEDQVPQIAERWTIWRTEKQRREEDDAGHGLNSASVFAAMNRLVPQDAIIAVDVGNNTYSFGRYFECHRQRRAHVRLFGVDRVRLPRRDGGLGGHPGVRYPVLGT